MGILDYLMLIAIIAIWLILLINLILTIAGYFYYLSEVRRIPPKLPTNVPMVTIMVPAHNEGIVITKTVQSLLDFDYPQNRYEIIVINDNSSDNSGELLSALQQANPDRQLVVINTTAENGGQGKSNALNIGLQQAKGSVIAIYDADNTPERQALRILVAELEADPELGAVIGKFRTRNKNATWLTRFINIETLSFQWMAQAGRARLFKLCTIPGTNYVIRRSLLEEVGGWDVKALAEDTEISFRVYLKGLRIRFQPKAVTWEQEPQTLGVWFHQRTRWVKGNIYVIIKNSKLLFNPKARRIHFDLLYFLAIYFLLMTSLVMSDIVLILTAAGYAHVTLAGLSNLLWILAVVLFVVSTFVSITTEKGEMTLKNLGYIVLMYVTYSQLWLAVAFWGMIQYFRERVLKRPQHWYKTQRYQ